jgi:hypothetical protein
MDGRDIGTVVFQLNLKYLWLQAQLSEQKNVDELKKRDVLLLKRYLKCRREIILIQR